MPFGKSPFSIVKETLGISSLPEEVQTVNKFMLAMEPIHKVYTQQWFINLANYAGNQYIVYDGVTRRFTLPPAPTWRVRLVINKILPIVRTQIAKLKEANPSFFVSPKSSEKSDFDAAKISSKFIKSVQTGQEFADTYDDMIHWVVTCGNAFIFPLYDEDAGLEFTEAMKDEDGNVILDPETQKPIMESFATGDVAFDLANPFEVVPDFSTLKWGEQFALVKKKLRSVEYIQEKYGVKVDPEPMDMSYENILRSMAQATAAGVLAQTRDIVSNAALVKDYYQNPSKEYPRGRHIIIANNKLLHSGVLTTKLRGKYAIPCVHFTALKVPNRLLAMSPIENLLPLQWKYNRGRSQIIEDINMMGRPKLVCPEDSIRSGAYTDQPGEMIEVDPGAPWQPFLLQPGSLISQAQLTNLDKLDQEMQDIGGIHDISLGRLPRRATSGIALTTLEEKDNTIIGPIKDSIKIGLERLFTFALGIVEDKFTETRKLKILGKQNEPAEYINYTGSDIAGNDDVRVFMDNPFPQSRAARLEFAISLVKEGIVSSQSARRILALDDFSNLDDIMQDSESQRIAQEQAAVKQLELQSKPAPAKK